MRSQPSEIDQTALYGRHDRVADQRADIETDSLAWRNRLYKKAAHRALNQPIDDDSDDMNIDQRRYGIGWKELGTVGGLLLAAAWLWQQSGASRELIQSDREVIRETAPAEPHEHTDRDTAVIPRLRFGPEE